ncbi:uncharacterized protein LMH87_008544 [Akanthomyces muscarius]|uniref:Carboxylic ester hydrolase n=1 Tax=Akanthomyces muscarius TaxID=2231603 RepID=A0A9W8QJE0_AKAMU|nr:uncharacterized protein LMH87_008544 [Akanthomyces muscarius]KAJ4157997.1 hypothetical protein LMH87_008544 [Akanthomyces muscarius]
MSDPQDVASFSSPLVTVETGALSGRWTTDGGRAFLGVPYAAPPVKELRWRAPQSAAAWDGVRRADTYGPSSVQFPPPPTSIYYGGETNFSEDCLYLNIWTGTEGICNRPVLVWLHFGAFLFGSGSNPSYDGEKLAAQGLTVVTLNYRLGRLGFLAHPELSAESEGKTSGNYGILDQIAALRWVQRNVEAFGGDPGNVTLGGASAGASSTHLLRCAPSAKGLFSKVICESGPGLTPAVDDGPGHVASFSSLHAAEEAGEDLLRTMGVESVAALRNVPAEQIVAADLDRSRGPWKSRLWPGSSSLCIFDAANPTIDGHVISMSPLAAFTSGKALDVPMLAGNVANESSGLPHLESLAEYQAFVSASLGEHQSDALEVYTAANDTETKVASSQLLSDQVFLWPMLTAARLQVRTMTSPAWYYRFLRAPPIAKDQDIIEADFAGAFHCAGAEYAFGNFEARSWDWTGADRRLSDSIADAWVYFMGAGDRNGPRKVSALWPAVQRQDCWIKIWDVDSRLEKLTAQAGNRIAFWDRYYSLEEKI